MCHMQHTVSVPGIQRFSVTLPEGWEQLPNIPIHQSTLCIGNSHARIRMTPSDITRESWRKLQSVSHYTD